MKKHITNNFSFCVPKRNQYTKCSRDKKKYYAYLTINWARDFFFKNGTKQMGNVSINSEFVFNFNFFRNKREHVRLRKELKP